MNGLVGFHALRLRTTSVAAAETFRRPHPSMVTELQRTALLGNATRPRFLDRWNPNHRLQFFRGSTENRARVILGPCAGGSTRLAEDMTGCSSARHGSVGYPPSQTRSNPLKLGPL